MLLAIDAGNTNTVFAVFNGDAAAHVWRCQTDPGRTGDEYAAWLYQLFSQAGLTFAQVGDVIIASVVPDANFHLQKLCANSIKREPLFVTHDITGLAINLASPQDVGADRLVNAVAVIEDYKCPAVVIDFGTATTFDVIDAKGAYCGGIIAPGVNLSASALHAAAAKLPKVSIKKTQSVIGTDTVSAMQAGIFWGYVSMIEGLLARIETEMGGKPFVIATGGLAHLFGGTVDAIEKVDEDLTLKGLLKIHTNYKNRKAA